MDSLKDLLPKALSRHGIGRQVKAISIWAAWEEIATQILSPEVSGEVEFISFQRGFLKVGVPGPSFCQAVKLEEIKLTEALNKKLKAEVIKKIQPTVIN
ncbi:DciA family protein [Patescibacteria group bacterium]